MYKVVVRSSNGAPLQMYKTIHGPLCCGWYKAHTYPNKVTECNNSMVSEGIHAYVSKKQCSGRYVMKCWACVKDLIAVGDRGDIVFTKIFIPKKEYDRVHKMMDYLDAPYFGLI